HIGNVLLGISITIICIVLFWFLILKGLGEILFGSLPKSSKTELIENFKKKERNIIELKDYYNSIVPTDYTVSIEFKSDNEINNFRIIFPFDSLSMKRQDNIYVGYLKNDSSKTDSLLKILNWTPDNIIKINNYLDSANSISVENGEPSKIGFRRDGFGMLYYQIFENPIPDTLHEYYDNGCNYIQYNAKTVLEYESGAIGNNCFPLF
ncbi:MAG: hypothetical protein LH629_11195, partial [Ignavibacteria bacterium]|nr:hypothetical protein [Ignavibacteria bacterium]